MKYFVGAILFILVMLAIFYGIPNTDKNIRESYRKLYEAKLNGKIEYLSIRYHRDSFKLTNSNEFVFSSYPILDNQRSFSSLAEKGNRVVKLSNSDTLVLAKESKAYKFLLKREL
jgi:hypothetical protein